MTNREFKFRNWDNADNEMYYFDIYDGAPYHHQKGRRTIMQYTGLKDKNGRGIYEGDIAAVYEGQEKQNFRVTGRGLVQYDKGAFDVVSAEEKSYGKKLIYLQSLEWADWFVEVIGNIHENPELLPKNS